MRVLRDMSPLLVAPMTLALALSLEADSSDGR